MLPNLNGGGAERVAITYMRQLDYKKYDLSLAVFDQTTDLLEYCPKGVPLVNLGTVKTSSSFLALLRLIRRTRPHIVYTSHSRVAALLMLIKPFAPRFLLAARLQSTPSLDMRFGAYGGFRRWMYARGFRSADLVAAETDEMMKDAIDVFRLPVEKVMVLNNPVDKTDIEARASVSNPLDTSSQVCAVAAGRLSWEKGFDVLIRALARVVEVHEDFVLYILGKHHDATAQIERLIHENGLEQNVRLEGFIKNPYPYYKHCDMFILSSRWEGFPNAFIENFCLNTPIVATRCVPVIEQLISEDQNGFLCDVDDEECLTEKILRCVRLDRAEIRNHYQGSNLDSMFSRL